jgi:hypothetical protein
MCEDVTIEDYLRGRLKEHGIDVEVWARAELPAFQVSKAVYLAKDLRRGGVGFLAVPQTEWYFEGVVYLVSGVLFLVDKKVASDWKILGTRCQRAGSGLLSRLRALLRR